MLCTYACMYIDAYIYECLLTVTRPCRPASSCRLSCCQLRLTKINSTKDSIMPKIGINLCLLQLRTCICMYACLYLCMYVLYMHKYTCVGHLMSPSRLQRMQESNLCKTRLVKIATIICACSNYVHTYMHTNIHACKQKYMHTYIHTYGEKTLTHTNIHT